MTEEIMHKLFGVPFLAIKRPQWDKFPGAEYTIGSDSIMPDGKIIQQPSTHLLGQHFSKPFDVKFIDKNEKKKYVWQTTYGPCMSRILASIISVHGDDNGLILPFVLSPIQVVIIPFYSKKLDMKIKKMVEEVRVSLSKNYVDVLVDDSDKRPGEKFFYWELKGVPFRVEIGEEEVKKKKVKLVVRDNKDKVNLALKNLADDIKNLGAEYDERILSRANNYFKDRIVDCKTKEDIMNAFNLKKIARFNFCSNDPDGASCAEYIEKKLLARIMGSRVDILEKPKGKCIFCGKKAKVVSYAGKSY